MRRREFVGRLGALVAVAAGVGGFRKVQRAPATREHYEVRRNGHSIIVRTHSSLIEYMSLYAQGAHVLLINSELPRFEHARIIAAITDQAEGTQRYGPPMAAVRDGIVGEVFRSIHAPRNTPSEYIEDALTWGHA